MTRKRFHTLAEHLGRYLYNFDEYMADPFSHEHQQDVDDLTYVATSLSFLSRTTQTCRITYSFMFGPSLRGFSPGIMFDNMLKSALRS